MFERYTESARRALFFARYQASQFGSLSIGTSHLLLGLLQDDKGLIAATLSTAGVSADDLRGAVVERLTSGPTVSTSVELPFEDDVKRALVCAAEEADRLMHNSIDKAHLFLGLLRDEDSVAGSVLHARGLRLDDVRRQVVAWIHDHPSIDSSPVIQQVHQLVDAIKDLVDTLAMLPPGDQADAIRRTIHDRLDWFKGPRR